MMKKSIFLFLLAATCADAQGNLVNPFVSFPVAGAPVFGNVATGSIHDDGHGVINISVTAPTITGSNTLLLAAVSVNGGNLATAFTTVTYNGVSIIGTQIDGGSINYNRTRVYYVVNPTSAATFSVDFDSDDQNNVAIVVAYYTGVNQSTPIRTATTGTTTTNPSSLAVTNSQSGDLIVGLFGLDDTASANGMTTGRVGAGQTFRAQVTNSSSEAAISLCDEAGASGTVTHSWDFVNDANNGSSSIAIPLIPVP